MTRAHCQPRINKAALFADLGYTPHDGQLEVHRSTAHRRVVACGVRWGKTLCAAMEGLAAALEPKDRSMGWVVAPTYDLADKVFRELLLLIGTHLRHRVVVLKESERRIVLRNMGGGLSEIRGKSADNSVSLLGEGLDWLIVDEAARLKPSVWQSHLSQRLIDRRGWALLISTPKGKGWFHELFQRGQRGEADHASWNHPSWNNPHLDRELIEQERTRLPERVFEQEYCGRFIEGSGAVFRGVRECATGEWKPPRIGEVYAGGLDLAKVEDFTVLSILNLKRELVFVDRFHRIDWALQVQRIKKATWRFHKTYVLVDSTGVGEPVFEALRMADCYVKPYSLTAASKAALINNLAMMIEQQQIVLPRPDLWPEGIDELESFQYSVTDSGHVKTEAPSGIHDDCVISLGLAAWTVRPNRPRPHFARATKRVPFRVHRRGA
jgi:hypothetical protein